MFSNFIPTVWTETIERELAEKCVFAEDCNRQYEGEAKKKGDTVKILGIGKPTIKTVTSANRNNNIDAAEEVQDQSVNLVIDQIRYFNFMVGDIDQAQSSPKGILSVLNSEATEGLASEMDKNIANLANDSAVTAVFSTVPKVVAGTASSGEKNVLDILDEAVQILYENDVSMNAKIVATVSPRFYTLFRREFGNRDTNNSEILKNGVVGMYGNIVIKLSNAVKKTTTTSSNDTDHIMLRTQRAIAFANPFTHVEAYRPELKFADAVKGYTVFGSKIVRAKEIVDINVKY